MIVKWEKLKMNILDQRNSLRDLNLLKLNIENVGTDLDTLAGIILEEDEEYSQESSDEDQELTDMRHQLFEVHWIWFIWMSIFMEHHIP